MMVKLSAMTVDEGAGYEISSSGGGGDVDVDVDANVGADGWHEEIVCGIPSRRIKILLTNDLRQTTGEDSHQEGANVDAWYDRDGTVFVLIDNGNDVCYMEAEEYEALECIEDNEVIEDAVTNSIATDSWEADALAAIKGARLYVAEMESRHLEAKERAKDCKADWESAVNRLTEVIDAATKPLPLFDRPTATATPADTPDPTDEAWRETPISEIFLGIRGLGAKKREAIQAIVPTLGAFEDLRKKASLDGEPLKTYMPPGVGQEACDQLEEAALNWVSAHFYPADEDEDEDEAGDDDEGDDEGGEA